MQYVLPIINFVKWLGESFSKAYLTLFIYRAGENREIQKGKTKEVKDAKSSAKLKNRITTLSDDGLDSGLRKPRSRKK